MYQVHALCEKDEFTEGIWTSAQVKVHYAISARKHVRDGTLSVLENMICANPKMKDDNDHPVNPDGRSTFILSKLREQLLRYKQVENDTTNPLSLIKSGISGVTDRHGKKDPSAKDDLALAFTFACGIVDNLRSRVTRAKKYPGLQSAWLCDN